MESDQISRRSVHQGTQEKNDVKYGKVVYMDFKDQTVWIDMEFNGRTFDIKFDRLYELFRVDPCSLRAGEFLKLSMTGVNIYRIEQAELTPTLARLVAWIDESKLRLKLDEYGTEIDIPKVVIKDHQCITNSCRFVLWKAKDSYKFAELLLESSPQPDLGYQGPNQLPQATNPSHYAHQDPYNQLSSSANLSSHSQAHQYLALVPPQSSIPGYRQPSYSPVPIYQPQLESPYYYSIEHKEYLQFKLNEKILTCGKERLPLDVLRDSYSDSKIRQRLEKLKEEFDSFRKSRGDGNCYYRAVGVAYLEHLCRQVNYESDIIHFMNRLHSNQGCFAIRDFNLHTRNYLVQNLKMLHSHKSIANDMLKLEELLQDPYFDNAIIAELRCITANYLEMNKDSDEIAPFLFDGIGNKLREILTYGNEAEGIEFSCLARGLGVFIKHISMVDDHSYDVYGPENVDSAPLLHVFYKGGHYDMIYTKNMTAIDGYDLFNLRYGRPQEFTQEMANSLFHINIRPQQVEKSNEEMHAQSLDASLNMSLSYNSEFQPSALHYSPQVTNLHYQSHHESSLTGSNMKYILGQAPSVIQYLYHQNSSQTPQYPSSIPTPYNQQPYHQPKILNPSMQADTSGLHQSIPDPVLHNRTLNPIYPMNASTLHESVEYPVHNQKFTNPYDDTPGQTESYGRIQENPASREREYSTPGFPDHKDYSVGQYDSNLPSDTHNPIQAYDQEVKNPYSSPQAGKSDHESSSIRASQKGVDSIAIRCGCRISHKDLNDQLKKLVYSLPDKVYISKYLCRSCYDAFDIIGDQFISEQIQQLQCSKPSIDQKQASLKQTIPCICCELEDIPLNRHRDFPNICLRCLLLLINFQIIDFKDENDGYRGENLDVIKNSFSACSVCKGIYKLQDVIDYEKLQFMKMKPRCGECKDIYKCDICRDRFDKSEISQDSKHFKCKKCVDESRRR